MGDLHLGWRTFFSACRLIVAVAFVLGVPFGVRPGWMVNLAICALLFWAIGAGLGTVGWFMDHSERKPAD